MHKKQDKSLLLVSFLRYLNYSIDPNSGIRVQDSRSVFAAVYRRAGGVDVAFKFLDKNFDAIET
jgi:hypothetical protein